jgi:pimeloyl-ACP methyl ester carboxylesterase
VTPKLNQLSITRQVISIDGAALETFQGGTLATHVLAAAHPASMFGGETVRLLADIALTHVLCLNPRGLGGSSPSEGVSLEQIVDDLEAVRRRLDFPPWVFWGMSGGGWLAQIYAHRHPSALAGVIIESACLCFRERLADPTCALSPFFPAWRDRLRARGLLREDSHADASPADDSEWTYVEHVGHVLRRRGGPALLVASMAVDQDMKRAMPKLWTFDSRSWIGSVRTPVLVIAGGSDPVVPLARVRAVQEAIRGAVFVEVAGAGHVPSAERRPAAVEAVRSFLASLQR